jgi:hypothetical protein
VTAIQQAIYHCPHCQRATIHHRNAARTYWGLHVVLMLLTLGLWLPFMLACMVVFNQVPTGPWLCTACGRDPLAPPAEGDAPPIIGMNC